jgi:hypothetical protein
MTMKKLALASWCILASAISYASDIHQDYFYNVVKKDRQLASLVKKEVSRLSSAENFNTLLGGPSSPAQKWIINGKIYYKYNACEAHNCFDNSMIVLFQPKSKQVAGVLFDGCNAKGFGTLNQEMVNRIAQETGTDPSLNRCKQ